VTALLVGNPSFRKDFAQLANLPQAEREAKEIGALLPGSEILTRESATKGRILKVAGQHEIVHFGGHAVINQEFPLLSYLVLSPSGPGDSGLLYAHELYSSRFGRCRLAVLAACSTANGPVHGEGVVNFARAFLAAGVPNVVASFWAVEDAVTERLFQEFYSQLRNGLDPASALQKAQIDVLKSSDQSPQTLAVWTAFEIIGGVPEPNPIKKKE
jgi:CHAT domain-containing protein